MTNFKIETLDGNYTYSQTLPATISMKMSNNNKFSNTQGYLIKKQVGAQRVEMTAQFEATKANIEAYIWPMETYPSNVKVTIDRYILNRAKNNCEFVIKGIKIQELTGDDQTGEQSVTISLIEVLEN